MLNGGLLKGSGKELGPDCNRRREANAKSQTQKQVRRTGKPQRCARGQQSIFYARKSLHKWLKTQRVPYKLRQRLLQVLSHSYTCGAFLKKMKRSPSKRENVKMSISLPKVYPSGKCRVCRALRQHIAEARLAQETVGHITSARCVGQSEAATAFQLLSFGFFNSLPLGIIISALSSCACSSSSLSLLPEQMQPPGPPADHYQPLLCLQLTLAHAGAVVASIAFATLTAHMVCDRGRVLTASTARGALPPIFKRTRGARLAQIIPGCVLELPRRALRREPKPGHVVCELHRASVPVELVLSPAVAHALGGSVWQAQVRAASQHSSQVTFKIDHKKIRLTLGPTVLEVA